MLNPGEQSTQAAETRRIVIAMAVKRSSRGSGSSTQFLMSRTNRMRFPILNSTLAPTLWAAVGAAATRLYMPERMTNDLDILIRPEDSGEVRAKLTQAGATYQEEHSIGGSSWRLADGFDLDVIEGRGGWLEESLVAAQSNLDGQDMPILPMRFLVLMKFEAGRVQDVADVTRMVGQAGPDDLSGVRQTFEKWLPGDQDDLESLILLGQLEMK
jgi:hypothetical protein